MKVPNRLGLTVQNVAGWWVVEMFWVGGMVRISQDRKKKKAISKAMVKLLDAWSRLEKYGESK